MPPFSIRLYSLDTVQRLLLDIFFNISVPYHLVSTLILDTLQATPEHTRRPIPDQQSHQTPILTQPRPPPCPPPSSPQQTRAPAPALAPRQRPTTARSTASTAQVSHTRAHAHLTSEKPTNTPPSEAHLHLDPQGQRRNPQPQHGHRGRLGAEPVELRRGAVAAVISRR